MTAVRGTAPSSALDAGSTSRPSDSKSTDALEQAQAILGSPPDVLARLWEKVDALARHRKIDPELRRDLMRVAEKVYPTLAEQIMLELDVATPAAVLEAHEHELIEDRPSLGAFPRRDSPEAPTAAEWLREDARRLRRVTLEVARFTTDDRLVAESVLSLAETLELEFDLAVDIIASALRDARHPLAVAR